MVGADAVMIKNRLATTTIEQFGPLE